MPSPGPAAADGRENGRSERIRTSGPSVPNTVLYQAELHSGRGGRIAARLPEGKTTDAPQPQLSGCGDERARGDDGLGGADLAPGVGIFEKSPQQPVVEGMPGATPDEAAMQ